MVTDRKRVALYLRVSTEGQDEANQRPELDALVRTRGWEVVEVYAERASAAKKRPEFGRLLLDARRGAFDVVAVWALDRFGRSMVGNLEEVRNLAHAGVALVSVREPWLDTGGPVRDLLLAIFSWVAEQERERLILRTVAGLNRARGEGTPLGRPRVPPLALAAAAARVASGETVAAAAAATTYQTADGTTRRVGERTLRRYLREREVIG